MNEKNILIYMPLYIARLFGVMAALLPALGPAAPYLSGSLSSQTYIEICTAFGIVKKAVQGDLPASGDPQSGHNDSNPCLFCGLRQFALAPPDVRIAPALSASLISWPSLGTEKLSSSSSALSYNSRAPPVLLS